MKMNSWTNFWFGSASRETYCLLRIFTGFFLILRFMGVWGIYRINNLSAKLPMHRYAKESDYMLDAFRHPISFFEWLPVPSFFYYKLIFEWGMFFLAILFTLGLFSRIVAPLLAVLLLYWTLLSQFYYYHHMITFLLVILVLGFSNCWQHYSLDSYLFGEKIDKKDLSIFPIRQLQVVVSIIYFFSLLAKLNPGWFEGRVLESMYAVGAIKGIFSPIIFKYVSFKVMSWFTIFSEAFLIFGLWFRKTRTLAIFIGVLFHLGIDATMGVATFSYQILALYLVFLTLKSKATVINIPNNSNWLIFSRACNLLDWFRRLDWQKNESSNSKFAVTLSTGEVLTKVQALRAIFLRIPLLFPFQFFLTSLLSLRDFVKKII